ncbi:ribbon-helix-helix protein, CopG family [Leptolyngbya sp. FACHB-671]|uniref:ribbon-helix-helix protein, CopG family n=1 Tax=Leptolyngbya sp. FACHB-671 TaxID=2692812 RepID=UPI001683FD58|nr:ribbon-helix-helix protein, CopG family [Leptolyngbya sp. FACHB-671]MBD2066218.1 ribbon-helix-helix protein, CopG family [Leptolyngbya sp. FACHB-671]
MPGVSLTTKPLGFRLSNDQAAALELLAAKRGVDRSSLVREALLAHFGSQFAELLVTESRKRASANHAEP